MLSQRCVTKKGVITDLSRSCKWPSGTCRYPRRGLQTRSCLLWRNKFFCHHSCEDRAIQLDCSNNKTNTETENIIKQVNNCWIDITFQPLYWWRILCIWCFWSGTRVGVRHMSWCLGARRPHWWWSQPAHNLRGQKASERSEDLLWEEAHFANETLTAGQAGCVSLTCHTLTCRTKT